MERAGNDPASKLPCDLEQVAEPLRPVSQLEHVGLNQTGLLLHAGPDANTAGGHYTQGPILTKLNWPHNNIYVKCFSLPKP